MKTTVEICGERPYSPLITAMEAIIQSNPGDRLVIILDDNIAFGDLKTYLSEREIGFREVYDGNLKSLEFIKP